jgi:hypothetical protein
VTRRLALVAVLLVSLAAVLPAGARQHLGGRKGGAEPPEPKGDDAGQPRMTIRASGLEPVFARDAVCPGVASPYGSSTRYDGSRRPMDRFGGLHGGIDISLDEGTPLRAIAAGKVISSGQGGMFTGNFLWLQHSPEDTGLPFWVYSKYQHFRDAPDLAIGTPVKVGQVIGPAGRTGTQGRHYGPSGYPHLHLTTFAGPSERFEPRESSVLTPGSKIFDPVALYVPDLRDVDDVDRLPKERKQVAIPYVAEDGTLQPASARLLWPVACKRR